MKYQLIINEFGSWDLFQELLSILHSVAILHSPLTIELSPDDITCVEHVTVAMVAIAYVLRICSVSGVILGSFNMRFVISLSLLPFYYLFSSASHLRESIMATHLILTDQDLQDIEAVLKKRCGPRGVVFGLERDQKGLHGSVIKYNLNQLNQPSHLEEICVR